MNRSSLLLSIFSIFVLVLCIFIKYSSINVTSREDHILSIINGEEVYANVSGFIDLGEDYVTTDIKDGNIISLKDDKIIKFNDLIKDKTSFNEMLYNKLRLKYPKFIVDVIINQDLNVTYLDDKKIKLVFDNSSITPPINEELSFELICKDYNDYVLFDCDKEYIEEFNYIDESKPVVALTFDDGPCNNTYKAIEELKNNNMSATFFELGSLMKRYPEIVKEVKNNGFEIASHGYSHTSFLKLKVEGTKKEIDLTNEIYKEITGEDLSLVRPPYGSINPSIRDGIDTTFVRWSVDSLDWKEKDKFIDNVMSVVKDGDIILMHDIHSTTVDGLSTLLPLLYSRGFRVVDFSTLAKIKGISIEKNKVYYNLRNN